MEIIEAIKVGILWIGAIFPVIKAGADIIKTGMDSAKTAQEIFQKSAKSIEESTIHDEHDMLDRAQAASDLLKSYSWFYAVSACFRLGMFALLVWFFKEFLKILADHTIKSK